MDLQSTNFEQLGRQAKRIVAALYMVAAVPSLVVAGENSYAQEMLELPSQAIVSAEAKGRVTIFDGLKSETVDRALDNQFERIENMMFIRTQHQQESGEYEADDDC